MIRSIGFGGFVWDWYTWDIGICGFWREFGGESEVITTLGIEWTTNGYMHGMDRLTCKNYGVLLPTCTATLLCVRDIPLTYSSADFESPTNTSTLFHAVKCKLLEHGKR